MALLKMTMLSFKSFDNPMDLLKPKLFFAMFNPASYKVEYAFNRDSKEPSGSNGQDQPITSISVRKMTFDFLIDGTGANGDERIVLLEAQKFEKIVMPGKEDVASVTFTDPTDQKKNIEEKHLQLPKLLLVWGTFIFPCEIENFSVNYTLFDQLGIPLRATISATFTEKSMPSNDLLSSIGDSATVETISNVASFLSTAYTVTNNVAEAVNMARDENLNSLRQHVTIK